MEAATQLEDGGVSPATRETPRNVLDNLLEGCQVIDREFRYVYVNAAVAKQGKATPDSLVGRTMMECYPGIENTEMFSRLRVALQTRKASTLDNEFTFPDGTKGWFELRFEPVPEGVAILSLDVTARKRTEKSLERALRALTTLSQCNRTLVRTQNEQQFAQDVCNLLVEPGGYPAASIALLGGEANHDEATRFHASKTPLASRLDSTLLELVIPGRSGTLGRLSIWAEETEPFESRESSLLEEIAMDVGYGVETLRERARLQKTEKQLVSARRLEAVGRLAGGIAHDFNNLMSVVLSYSWLTTRSLSEDDPIRSDIDKMRQAGERAAALTKQLLAFSRKQVMEPQVTNVNAVIDGIEAMLRRLLGDQIIVVVHPADDLGNTVIDPGQLEQVIMNLAVNARDAMLHGGTLTLETDNVTLDDEYTGTHITTKPGRYVRLSVTDTGVGMSAETREQIFDPFFTTKEAGNGTGLGLATVYGIVKQSGGSIWVYSEVGRGTTFKLYFPRVDAPATERTVSRQIATSTGNEMILIVEDDPPVRAATERILKAVGYRVLVAAGGAEALELLDTNEEKVDLLLTDMMMPKMSGQELSEKVRARQPDLRVLFTSGYTDNTIALHAENVTSPRFLPKPFSAAELTNKVRQVLETLPHV